jgi:hypothetical protein
MNDFTNSTELLMAVVRVMVIGALPPNEENKKATPLPTARR